MLKRINKLIPPRHITISLMGLVIAVGALAQRAQPVLSKQIALLQTTSPSKVLEEQAPTYTWMEKNSDATSDSISKAARLRRVLDDSSPSRLTTSVPPGKTYSWIRGSNSSSSEEFENLSVKKAANKASKTYIKRGIQRKDFLKDDGVFLYGSSPETGELGKRYILFEKLGTRVVGAMYMPSSEFNCFQGTLDRRGEIAMTVKGYAGDVNPARIASRNRLPKLNENQLTNYAYSVTLQDYYHLNAVSRSDQKVLQTCKANFQ